MKRILTPALFLILSFPSFAQVSVDAGKDTSFCIGGCANLQATVSGGTPPYTYNWSGGQTSAGPHNVCPGDTLTYLHVVTVTDNIGASDTDTVQIIVKNRPFVNTSATPTACSNCNGTATATVTGGTSPYSYTWWTVTPTQTTPTVTALCSGSYTVNVTDKSGCSTLATALITTSLPQPIITQSNVTCFGGGNGVATVNVTGGTTPYTYSWTPSTGGGQIVYNLTAGQYTVTVWDAAGCTSTATTSILQPPSSLGITNSKIDANCGSSDGSITTTVSGGTLPYTYAWNTGATTPILQNLTSGIYTVTIVDNSGCSSTSTVIINDISAPTVTITKTDEYCGKINGSATANATGGVSPYTFIWSPGGYTGSVYTGLAAGTYTLSSLSGNGCITITTTTLVNTGITVSVVSEKIPVSCKPGETGTITVSASGGYGAYTYTWNTVPWQGNKTATGLSPGYYSVNVNDDDGCSTSFQHYLRNSNWMYLSVSNQNANCTTPGSATAELFNGTPPYTYVWNSFPIQTNKIATGLTKGLYSLTVSDSWGCQKSGYTYISYDCKSYIMGKLYDDINGNCKQDSGEKGLSGWSVSTNTIYNARTDSFGNYSLSVPQGNYTLSANPYYIYYCDKILWKLNCPSMPGTYSIPITNLGDTIINNDFAFSKDSICTHDLDVHPGWSPSRPGFPKKYWIYYGNHYPNPTNATIKFIFDSNLVYKSSTPPANNYDPVNHYLEWNIPNIYKSWTSAWQAQKIFIDFDVPATLSLGTKLKSFFSIEPVSGDCCPYNNSLDNYDLVTGSMDPNDKQVYPPGDGTAGNITENDSVLFYTIRFQNTGTDTAFTVVIVDTLSQNLEPASVISEASSHPYIFELYGPGIMKWTFNQILLPDSNVNEKNSHGFVNYRVKLKKGLPLGTEIKNTAGIYFDFNAPVITNTTLSTLYDPNGVKEIRRNGLSRVSLYPNPFSDYTLFEIERESGDELFTIAVYDLSGRIISLAQVFHGTQYRLQRESFADGLYLYKVFSSKSGLLGAGKIVVQ